MLKSLWHLLKRTCVCLLLLELVAWCTLECWGRPEYGYYASYMNGYKYDPYMAYHPATYPIYSGRQIGPSVVILGGSTAAGVGPVNGEDAYYRVMERSLNAHGKSIHLENYAAPGLVSRQEHAAYETYIFPRSPPRLLISLTSFNDLYFYLFRTLPIGNHEFNYAFEKVFRSGYPDPPGWKERVANFARRTNLYGLYFKAIKPDAFIQLSSLIPDPFQPNFSTPIPEDRIQAVAKNFLDAVLATALLAQNRGTKYLVILQPVIYYGGQIDPRPNAFFSNVKELERWINDVKVRKPEYDRFYTLVLAGLKKFKKSGLLDYLDYRSAVSGAVFLDTVHFNEAASKELGEKIAEQVSARL